MFCWFLNSWTNNKVEDDFFTVSPVLMAHLRCYPRWPLNRTFFFHLGKKPKEQRQFCSKGVLTKMQPAVRGFVWIDFSSSQIFFLPSRRASATQVAKEWIPPTPRHWTGMWLRFLFEWVDTLCETVKNMMIRRNHTHLPVQCIQDTEPKEVAKQVQIIENHTVFYSSGLVRKQGH